MRLRKFLTLVVTLSTLVLPTLLVAKDGERGKEGRGGGGNVDRGGGKVDRGGGKVDHGGGGRSRDAQNFSDKSRSNSGDRSTRSFAAPPSSFRERGGDTARSSKDAAKSIQRQARESAERASDKSRSFVRESTKNPKDRPTDRVPGGRPDDRRYVDRDYREDGRYTTGYRGDFTRDRRDDDHRGKDRDRDWYGRDDDRHDRDWDRDRYAHRHDHNYWRSRSYFFGYGSPFGRYLAYPWWYTGYGTRFGFYPDYGYGYRDWGRPGYYAYEPRYAYTSGGYYDDRGYVAAAPENVEPLPAPSEEKLAASLDFAGQGERAFKEGRYADAAQLWRHAVVDDPTNGAIVLLLAQALFQLGDWDEGAGAVQQAARMLPEDRWGTVIEHRDELYASVQDYTDQLKALERARDDKPDSPAIRFLLGYHFGFLGYPQQAVRELDRALELAPKDEVAAKLRDMMAAKLDGAGSQASVPRTSTRR